MRLTGDIFLAEFGKQDQTDDADGADYKASCENARQDQLLERPSSKFP